MKTVIVLFTLPEGSGNAHQAPPASTKCGVSLSWKPRSSMEAPAPEGGWEVGSDVGYLDSSNHNKVAERTNSMRQKRSLAALYAMGMNPSLVRPAVALRLTIDDLKKQKLKHGNQMWKSSRPSTSDRTESIHQFALVGFERM